MRRLSETRRYSLIHVPTGECVAQLNKADNWLSAGLGVMGWSQMPPGRALWLPGAASVHTFFVRFPLDLLFLSADYRTLRIVCHVPPWCPLIRAHGACHTIELAAGTLERIVPNAGQGDLWKIS